MRVDSRENLREAVAAGSAFGVATEHDSVADRRLRVVPLRGLDLSIADYLVCLEERRRVAPITALLELAAHGTTGSSTAAKGRSGR
jgi:DNA-binding transcriptional LysR family regulator